MNILITGIHGFVGSNLSAFLSNHTICGVSSTCLPGQNKTIHNYSWEELDGLSGFDVVIHLAGKAHDTGNKTDEKVYFDINTGLTKKIFDWFLQSATKKFIFFSTVKSVADMVDGVLTEDVVPCPRGPYGISKRAAEDYILANMPVNKPEKYVYILRPCMIHGPGNKGNLNLLYMFAKKGLPWPLGAFDNRRSFASISNVSFIINQLIEKNIASGIYNIADDDTLSTNEIIRVMCKTILCKCRILNISKSIITGIAMLGDLFKFPLNQERLRKLTESYIVSNKKIKKALDIRRLPLSASEGLINTVRSFELEAVRDPPF
jgi:nucleoside-diphosphate-sugar epimerase